jgi:tetratricopeptide (TPR) repeat protein
MEKIIKLGLLFFPLILLACGQDVILVRPHLDTPHQHLQNGQQLLDLGKFNDAYREFDRALELDSKLVSAHIGLGLALGLQGDFDAGLNRLRRAEALAVSPEEHAAVKMGYDRFDLLMKRPGKTN